MLNKKLEGVGISSASSRTQNFNAISEMNANGQIQPMSSTSDDANQIRILKRPTTVTTTTSLPSVLSTTVPSSNSSAYHSNEMTNSITPQIQLEDNTRTQYVAPVRILKRPTTNRNGPNTSLAKSNNSSAESIARSQASTKSYEEREAEYAKARLRILGSASPQEETSSTDVSSIGGNSSQQIEDPSKSNGILSAVSSTKLPEVAHNEVPVIRQPQGPNGSRGFNLQR